MLETFKTFDQATKFIGEAEAKKVPLTIWEIILFENKTDVECAELLILCNLEKKTLVSLFGEKFIARLEEIHAIAQEISDIIKPEILKKIEDRIPLDITDAGSRNHLIQLVVGNLTELIPELSSQA